MNHEEREQFADQFLDAALKQYSAAEPRPGLEDRILTNLAATASPRRSVFAMPGFAWAAAAAFALLLIAFGIWHSRRPAEVAHTPAQPAVAAQLPLAPALPAAMPPPVTTKRRHKIPAQELALREPPRLDQFPSPEPLSDQERLLLTYLRTTPREEVLVAVAQLQAEREEGLKRFNTDAPLAH